MTNLAARLRDPSPDLLYGLIAAGVILLSAVIRAAQVRHVAAPNILCDEFIYAGLARGLAEGDGYAYRGVNLDFSWVYPLLIAPGWFAGSMHTTFAFVKDMNVAVMSLAGVPGYLWARRFASPPWAVLATVLVLLIPAYAFTGLIMTENAAYPTFLAAAFVIALALERPRLGYQALALALIVLAWATRYQSVVLAPVLVAAALLERAQLRLACGHPEAGAQAPGAAPCAPCRRAPRFVVGGYLLYKKVTTGLYSTALGPYADLRNNVYPWREVGRWAILHLGELSLAVGVAPFAALLVLLIQGGSRPHPQRRGARVRRRCRLRRCARGHPGRRLRDEHCALGGRALQLLRDAARAARARCVARARCPAAPAGGDGCERGGRGRARGLAPA